MDLKHRVPQFSKKFFHRLYGVNLNNTRHWQHQIHYHVPMAKFELHTGIAVVSCYQTNRTTCASHVFQSFGCVHRESLTGSDVHSSLSICW